MARSFINSDQDFSADVSADDELRAQMHKPPLPFDAAFADPAALKRVGRIISDAMHAHSKTSR